VLNEAGDQVVYTLRIRGTRFRPKVFSRGSYSVKVSDPDTGVEQIRREVKSTAEPSEDVLQFNF
jgi:hypothetical protein